MQDDVQALRPHRLVEVREVSDRHREILEAALDLMAERGYAGASLRELARRVGMRQPSLYHYFKSKEELVEQVMEVFAGDMLNADVLLDEIPTRLDDVPRAVVEVVSRIYELPTHAKFVCVAFSVSRLEPRYGALMRDLFVERAGAARRLLAAPLAAAEGLEPEQVDGLVMMVANAMGLRLMEEHVLFDERPPTEDLTAYAEQIIEVAQCWIEAQRAKRLEVGDDTT